MKETLGAILWHCTDMKDIEMRHQFCPKVESRDNNLINKIKSLEKKHAKPISVFQSGSMISSSQLSSDNLLSKCLYGHTQNLNKSLHSVIWVKCPKNVFAERHTLQIGVYYAVTEFNEGCQGIHKFIEYMGLDTSS